MKVTRASAQRIRRKARLRMAYLVFKQGGKCYYCEEPIVASTRIDRRLHLSSDHQGVLTWYDEKEMVVRSCRKATIDHKLPISEGGGNHDMNLVAACWECNQRRHNALGEGLCRRCGRPKENKRSRECDACHHTIRLDRFLRKCGGLLMSRARCDMTE